MVVVTKCLGISTIDSSSTNLCAMQSFDHVLIKKNHAVSVGFTSRIPKVSMRWWIFGSFASSEQNQVVFCSNIRDSSSFLYARYSPKGNYLIMWYKNRVFLNSQTAWFYTRGRILGRNWDNKKSSSLLFTVTSTNRFYLPPPAKVVWNWFVM
jgi:hypothetical protein